MVSNEPSDVMREGDLGLGAEGSARVWISRFSSLGSWIEDAGVLSQFRSCVMVYIILVRFGHVMAFKKFIVKAKSEKKMVYWNIDVIYQFKCEYN